MKKCLLVGVFVLSSIGVHAGPVSIVNEVPKPPSPPMGSSLAPAPVWADLTEEEKAALAPLKDQFNILPKQQRRKWRALAGRFYSWPEDKKKMVQSRMVLWASMTQEQRAAARQQALIARKDGSSNRADVWKKWMELEPESQNDLHGKAIGVDQSCCTHRSN